MRDIADQVAAAHHLEPDFIFSPSRAIAISHPRQEIMWRCRQARNPDGSHRFSLTQIAMFLGGMDHTNIMHGVAAHERRVAGESIGA